MREHTVVGSFEGARGVAALLVAVYHFSLFMPFNLPYPVFIRYGYLFVDLFFVLSGYVICSSYQNRLSSGNAFWNFAIRRFGRLFPLLIFSTAVYVLIPNLHALTKYVLVVLGHQNMFASPTSSGYFLPSGAEILATLTMTHGLGLFDKAILNYVSWSISTEFYTYMLFAGVCIAISGRVRLAAFALLSVLAFLITCWASLVWHDCIANVECLNITYDFGLTRCIASFFMGCLTFHAAKFATRHESALQACALLAAGGIFMALKHAPALALGLPFVFALLILSLSSDRGFVARCLRSKPAQMLGCRSYSIYLLHPALIYLFGLAARYSVRPAFGIVTLSIYLTTLFIVSGLTYRFIEVPFRDVFNRWAGKQRLAPATEYLVRPD
ncbi:acyltransferase [Paraburkholderia sp. BL10I2N1]|uniref:acyltransferase family protein n=1 Tax=Paraburkholderia sp. BL10I2N1 TaxID=1938796 RepID=UPI0010DE7218|nr:acyltransferase [Paraburkholderia sp. BL10I2N1]TDN70547.1 peptidoglycan/LPS O-acetylase OafA/YrhL [Paraburkholderia sp. BL10I2N1]